VGHSLQEISMSLQASVLKIFIGPLMSYIARGSTINEQRAKMEKLSGTTKLAKDVEIIPLQVNGVRVEWITTPLAKPERIILYLHGGGYTFGLYNAQREFISRLGRAAEMRIFAVDYRLAPEHPFPAGLEDATWAYQWLLSEDYDPGKILFAGESSGGGLVLSTLLNLRDAGIRLPACAACFSPQTDMALTGESVQIKKKVDVVNRPFDVLGNAARYVGEHNPKDPLVSPLYADLNSLPPIIIHVGSDDILLDDSTRFANQAGNFDVDITLKVWSGMLHAFPLYASFIPEARQAIEQTGIYIRDKIRT
jgi:acetyl esterase/lipase